MSIAPAAAVGLVVLEVALVLGMPRPRRVAAVCAGVLWQPVPALLALVGAGAWRMRSRMAKRRIAAASAAREVLLLAELVGLAIGAGLGLHVALRAAASELQSGLRAEVDAVLRGARMFGIAPALAGTHGHAADFFRLLSRAAATGAPMGPAVSSFAAEVRRQARAEELAAARRLPVRLLLPLALLILPGFVILTLGPALLGGLDRLQFALPPVVGRLPA